MADFDYNRKGCYQFTEVDAEHALEIQFGGLVHGWPTPDKDRPRWWQVRRQQRECRINEALHHCGFSYITDAMRATFWAEVRKGQGIYEDAGGYCWRCWAVMLGYQEPSDVMSYPQAIEALMDGRLG